MQILHFNWLHYLRTVNNSHWVTKSMPLSFVLFPNKYFFKLHLPTLWLPFLHLPFLLLPFVSDYLGDTEAIRPFTLKGIIVNYYFLCISCWVRQWVIEAFRWSYHWVSLSDMKKALAIKRHSMKKALIIYPFSFVEGNYSLLIFGCCGNIKRELHVR